MQLCWWACILGAAYGMLWPAVLAVAVFAAWQLHPKRRHPKDPATLVLFVGAGAVLETAWPLLGIVSYASPGPIPGLAPAWMLLLWTAFGLTVHHSLAFFKQRWQWFIVLATVGSPMSYAAAERLGAVEWTAPAWLVVLCMGPVWAVVVGALLRRADRTNVALLAANPGEARG